ncbi:MAG TPA: lysyl oxidase family protein [Thermoleophilaceae bacterium]|jgi:hypothetical protein
MPARARLAARAAAAAACLVLAQGALAPAAPAADPVLPDLVADPPRWPALDQYTDANGTRLLLRFDGFVHNAGAGAVDLRASARNGTEMTSVAQRIYRGDGSWFEEPRPGATVRYEPEDGHSHWHLASAARYSLWDWNQTAEVAPAMKVGFCFEDSERVEANGPADAVYADDSVRFCEQHNPTVAGVYMGISAGWRDVYDNWLAFQWVDVSDVTPGRYWVHAEVDPGNVVRESDETNAVGVSEMAPTVPGYVAQPVTRQGLEAGSPATLMLRAVIWGDPGDQQFRIESPPAHGKLSVAAGEWFTGPNVTYTPDAGYAGTDSFSFSSRDSSSPFPLNPRVATATLGVERAAEAVAVSGAPAQVYTGTSVQLAATVPVTWSVNGVAGGSAALGTISPAGLYSAPASPPPGGQVTIRATGASGAYAEVVVSVVAAQGAAPAPGTPGGGDPAPVMPPLLAVPRVSVRGRTISVSTVPGRSGVVETAAMYGKRRIGLCRTRATARRRLTCRITVARRYRLASIRLTLELRVGNRQLAARSARLPRR